MSMLLTRRRLMAAAGSLPLVSAFATGVLAAPLRLGPARPYDFSTLRERARRMSGQPYRDVPARMADLLEGIDYDVHQKIRFRPDKALWTDGDSRFPLRFFHLGRYFKQPVGIFVVANNEARELLYSADYFDYGNTGLAPRLPDDLGFAGFRVMDGLDKETDWLAFLGASYFRSSGALAQYGLSARGVAIDTAMPTPEEFPRFTAFWLHPATPETRSPLVIDALLDGASLTGAFRFSVHKTSAVVMDVQAELFMRKEVQRLGIAPLTSMYWYAEADHRRAIDWRPEIHDSDGLAIWTGSGERIWRPLNNPPTVQTNMFADRIPRGFGLLQRDRDFANYQDDGAFYDRRPGLWVEPKGDWGAGAVTLVEIPTDDETHDNIVAFWTPAETARAGSTFRFEYRLHWVNEEPFPPQGAGLVVATRLGHGGTPGQPRPKGRIKFVIDFKGGALDALAQRYDVEPVVSASRGTITNRYSIKVVGTDRWRGFFDLEAEGRDPVDLRCFLRLDGRTLTETWLYQYFPGDV